MKTPITIGMDIGDRINDICILDAQAQVLKRDRVPNTPLKGTRVPSPDWV